MAAPSIDPADCDSVIGTLKHGFKKMMDDVHIMMPAKIVSVDNTSTPAIVSVQPLINMTDTDNNSVKWPVINGVLVVQIGAGNFLINIKLQAGDFGYIFAADGDLSNAVALNKESQPNTTRSHSFSDSIFLPAMSHNYINKTEQLSIQSKDGNTYITFNNDIIAIKSNTLTITANTVNLTASSIDIHADMLQITSKVGIIGDVHVVGNITASGSITPNHP